MKNIWNKYAKLENYAAPPPIYLGWRRAAVGQNNFVKIYCQNLVKCHKL